MADTSTTPLTEDERAELEALRAEKARREQEARDRAERAELEALRAEQVASHPQRTAAEQRSVSAPDSEDTSGPKSFGERMVTSDAVDDDGIPTMPPAQKLIHVVCALAIVGIIVNTFTR